MATAVIKNSSGEYGMLHRLIYAVAPLTAFWVVAFHVMVWLRVNELVNILNDIIIANCQFLTSLQLRREKTCIIRKLFSDNMDKRDFVSKCI